MSPSPDRPELSAAEWQLIERLRAVPDGELRERLYQSLTELAFFFETPRCEGVGVEGFPCGVPRSACEDCHQIWDTLERVAVRAHQA